MTKEEQVFQLLAFAQKLEGSTIGEQNSPYALPPTEVHEGHSNKGAFGQYLERSYFGLENNNKPEPDFWPIPLELKAAPLKYSEKKELTPKERIVLGIINYNDIVNESYEKSHFVFKNQAILIVWYIYNKELANKDVQIDLADIWRCIQEDGKQIEEDWNTIYNKVKNGHAEDISEGDTLFLGACTKGSDEASSYRTQPFSSVLAKQRAFCFKISYVKHIYDVMKQRRSNRVLETHLIPENSNLSLEQTVLSLFAPYYDKTSKQIEQELNIQTTAKSRFAVYARTILGFSQRNQTFYEFNAANIQIKTIRIERNGKIKEDMSFKNIKFKEIISQTWEDSDLYQELVSKFIFVIFKKTNDDKDYYLEKVQFWNMTESDLDIVHDVWEKTKMKTILKDFNNLPKKSENEIIHVRTKGKDSTDLTETADGSWITKRCFFLNNSYIASKLC